MAELKIKADSGGGTVSLKGPATTTLNAAVQLTLPVDDGAANQYLKTDGSGALSWATLAASPVTALNNATANELVTVGSTTTELDAEANLTFDGSTLTVTGHVKQDGGFGIMEPCFNATMGDDLAIFHSTQTTNDRWQNSGTAMNPGWDATNDYFKVPTGGAGHYVFIWTIKVGDNHQGHLDQGEIIDTSLAKNGTIMDKSRKRDAGQDNLYFCSTGFYSCQLADGDEIQMTHYQNEGGRLDLDDLQSSFCGFRVAEGD